MFPLACSSCNSAIIAIILVLSWHWKLEKARLRTRIKYSRSRRVNISDGQTIDTSTFSRPRTTSNKHGSALSIAPFFCLFQTFQLITTDRVLQKRSDFLTLSLTTRESRSIHLNGFGGFCQRKLLNCLVECISP
mmetsp:Transcript_8923/g.19106  ORF Transcript_8923/g.19106 Transcript_8923/m.19106 type:complete len:134 (-) Transcript_8923:1480-1881(-)